MAESMDENTSRTFDCPFCGKKDAFHDGSQWSMGYCSNCRKFIIVLSANKNMNPISAEYRKIIHEIFCEPEEH